MRVSQIIGLTNDGLIENLNYLQKEAERIMFYEKLKKIPEGKFLIAEMKDRLSSIRRMYATVPMGTATAALTIAGLQSEEFELGEWLERIENANGRLSKIEADIKVIQKEIEVRVADARKSSTEFRLPPLAKVRRKKND